MFEAPEGPWEPVWQSNANSPSYGLSSEGFWIDVWVHFGTLGLTVFDTFCNIFQDIILQICLESDFHRFSLIWGTFFEFFKQCSKSSGWECSPAKFDTSKNTHFLYNYLQAFSTPAFFTCFDDFGLHFGSVLGALGPPLRIMFRSVFGKLFQEP